MRKRERKSVGIVSLDPFWSPGPLPKRDFLVPENKGQEKRKSKTVIMASRHSV